MEELENKGQDQGLKPKQNANHYSREEIFSETVRAGKRTYFFDVKATRAGERYLTITESKRRFNNDTGKFFYEKHKLFLYKEDFEKFANGLRTTINFIQNGQKAQPEIEDDPVVKDPHVDVEFEDLGKEDEVGTETIDEKLI